MMPPDITDIHCLSHDSAKPCRYCAAAPSTKWKGVLHESDFAKDEPKPASAPLVQYLWIGTLVSGSGSKSSIIEPLPDFEHKTLLIEKSAFDAVVIQRDKALKGIEYMNQALTDAEAREVKLRDQIAKLQSRVSP